MSWDVEMTMRIWRTPKLGSPQLLTYLRRSTLPFAETAHQMHLDPRHGSIHFLQAGTNTHPRNHFVNLESLEALETDIPPVYKSPPSSARSAWWSFPVFFLRHLSYIPNSSFVRLFAFLPLCTQLTILSFVALFDYSDLRDFKPLSLQIQQFI